MVSITYWKERWLLFAWLSIVLKQGFEMVKNSTIKRATWEESFRELVQKAGKEFTLEIIERIMIAKSELFTDTHEVVTDALVSTCQMCSCS